MENRVIPGIHPQAILRYLHDEEKQIINKISKEWLITSSGEEIRLGSTSAYRYVIIKPTSIYQEMFNLEREIVVIFSNYDSFQPRTLDAIDYIIKKYQALRLEKFVA